MNVHDVDPLAAEFQRLLDFTRQATVPKQQYQGAIHLLPPSSRRGRFRVARKGADIRSRPS